MDGYIYIIHQENTSLYKIGYSTSNNPKKRLSNLQVGNPYPLIFVGSFYTFNIELEKMLHEYFSQYLRHGEWFELTQEHIENILDPEWRRIHGFYSDERECILNSLHREFDTVTSHIDHLLQTLQHLFYYDIYQKPQDIDSKR